MSLNDPISNCLTIIRNGSQARKETVDIPASKLIGHILEIFKEDGYIEDFRKMEDSVQGHFKVYLKYDGKKSVILGITRISRAGLRVYTKSHCVPRVLNGLGTSVVSTSKGVISGRDAYKQKIGGEVLCYIW
jgi:small subunit ribosomal protein S8